MFKKITCLLIALLVVTSGPIVFARSVEWNLERYEPYYLKIKAALEEKDLERAQNSAELLVSATRQEPDQGNTEVDVKFIERAGRNIIGAKNLDQANQAFSSFTKVIDRWKSRK